MRSSYSYRMASKENYNRFKEDHPNTTLSFLEWQNIIYTFNYGFRDHLLETGDRAKLPWGIGEFSISKKKQRSEYVDKETGASYKTLPVDWKKTKEKGKRIFHLNHHTNGFRFKWKWFIFSSRMYKADVFMFKPSRVTSRLLKHYIDQPNYQFLYKEWHLFL
jgi:hypothetical protein